MVMKRNKITRMMLGTLVAIALVFSACDRENSGENNGENGGGNNGEGGGGNQEYPSTVHILPQAVTDVDGNTYDAVQIGNQVWMAENLRATRYADDTSIPLGESESREIPYRYAPGLGETNEENMVNVENYGYLYNWPAVMHGAASSNANPSGVQGVCPNGWHVPSDGEWAQLRAYLYRNSEYACGGFSSHIAKALASKNGWFVSNGDACAVGNNPNTNNATGFSARPAGFDHGGYNFGFGKYAYFWSSTEGNGSYAYSRYLYYDTAYVNRNYGGKNYGFSVRCVRDE